MRSVWPLLAANSWVTPKQGVSGGTVAMIPKLQQVRDAESQRIRDSQTLRGGTVTEHRAETSEWLRAAFAAVALVAIALASGLRP